MARINLSNEGKSACDSVSIVLEDGKYIFEATAPFASEDKEFTSNDELIDFLTKRNLADSKLWEGDILFFFQQRYSYEIRAEIGMGDFTTIKIVLNRKSNNEAFKVASVLLPYEVSEMKIVNFSEIQE